MSINSVLNTAKDSLLTYQFAIGLTGSNIANVNTPGYSRQTPVLQSVGSADAGAGQIQFSVDVSGIARSYDTYIENQIFEQKKTVGYEEARNNVMTTVEGIFSEGAGGPSELMDKFWNAWEELSAHPDLQTARNQLLSAAENFTGAIRRIDDDLERASMDAQVRIEDMVGEINVTLSQIAELNTRILNATGDQGASNLLEDSRAEQIKKLADMIDITAVYEDRGAVDVFLADGHSLILGSNTWELAVKTTGGSVSDIVYKNDAAESLKEPIARNKDGRLAAFLEIVDATIPGYREKLDAFVDSLVSEVNSLHRQGYDSDGNPGGDFFKPPVLPATSVDAGSFRLSDAIISNINGIAVSSTVNGDGANALLIAQIKDKSVMNSGRSTLGDYYASLVGEVGSDVAHSKDNLAFSSQAMTQLANRRESVSGVSLDEEMMNLIKYQMSYNTSGKLVSTVNEMLNTLMQLVN